MNRKLTKTQWRQRQELIEIWFKERIDLEFPIISKYKLTKAQRGQRQQLIEI